MGIADFIKLLLYMILPLALGWYVGYLAME